jgi:hypothetical protein
MIDVFGGIMIDVTDSAQKAGFAYQTGIGYELCTMLEPTEMDKEGGETFERRADQMLAAAHLKAQTVNGDQFVFTYWMRIFSGLTGIRPRAIMYPGENGEPTIFIGLPGDF